LTQNEINELKNQKEIEKQRKEAQEKMLAQQQRQPMNIAPPHVPQRLPTLDDIPCDPQAMQFLLEAGFSEIR
jgi:type II secretory pathway pseudopilin PulG